MRRSALVLTLVLGACVAYRGPAQHRVSFDTKLEPWVALQAASAQLEQLGYIVTRHADGTVVTEAHPIPGEEASVTDTTKRYWVLRVDVEESPLSFETFVHVSGYVLPERGRITKRALRTVPVTAENRVLFGEVMEIADQVRSAARGRVLPTSVATQIGEQKN
ncbi:MAG: hypothetical protein ABR543_00915 [Gemmatimonadaceae bacterium]